MRFTVAKYIPEKVCLSLSAETQAEACQLESIVSRLTENGFTPTPFSLDDGETGFVLQIPIQQKP